MNKLKDTIQAWDEMVFDGKNRAYGAYVLRSRYPGHIITGFSLGLVVLLLILYAPRLATLFLRNEPEAATAELKTIMYTELAPPPSIEKLPPPPQQMQEVKKIVKYLPPKVTKEEVAEENVPTVEEIRQNDTGPADTEGAGNVVMDTSPVEEPDKGEAKDEVFTIAEEMPQFDGGMEALGKYLSKNMKYPPSARRTGVEGTVYVSFVVSRDGSISEVTVLKGIHGDCDAEAIRVISKMPAWKPGRQRGEPVKVKFVLPIKFKLN